MTQIQTIQQIRKDAADKQAVFDAARHWGAPVTDFLTQGVREYIYSEIAESDLTGFIVPVKVPGKTQIWIKVASPWAKKRKLLKITSDDEKLDTDITRILVWAKDFASVAKFAEERRARIAAA